MADHDSIAVVLGEWAQVLPGEDMTPIAVIARMARIRAIIEDEQSRVFSRAGVSHADFPVLACLRRRHPPYRLSHSALASDLGLTAGTVTTRVDRLAALGFVTRETDDQDGRIKWVTLTPKGLAVIDTLIPEHLAVEEELLAGLPRDVRDRLAADLSLLLTDLEARYRTVRSRTRE